MASGKYVEAGANPPGQTTKNVPKGRAKVDYVSALYGTGPASTGILIAAAGLTRSPVGTQPSATGTLTRIRATSKALVGAQPTSSATLTRSIQKLRALVGAQPASSAIASRKLQALRALAGTQPNIAPVQSIMNGLTPSGSEVAGVSMTVAQEYWTDESTTITEVQIYAGGSQSYSAYVWNMSGEILASGSATSPASAGWFSVPVSASVSADQHFKAGYFVPAGRTLYRTPNALDPGDTYVSTTLAAHIGAVGVNVDLKRLVAVLDRRIAGVGANVDLKRTVTTIERRTGVVGVMVDLRLI